MLLIRVQPQLLLLGQAESGKSTLQKQFQLMYNPNALEEERLSWRPVVYYNISRPVRRIFEVIEAYGEFEEDGQVVDYAYGTPDSNGFGSQSSDDPMDGSQTSSTTSAVERQLKALRYRLSPLIAAESMLAERLSGGSTSPTSSKAGNVLVRSGWQARSLLGKSKNRERSSFTGQRSSLENAMPRRSVDSGRTKVGEKDKLIEDVANILSVSKEDIRELWDHPTVQRLRDRRRLRLEEWAE